MSLEKSVNDLIDEIKKNGQNRKNYIEMRENEILQNFDYIQELKTKNFFKLPLINIFSIISNYDFSNQGTNQFSFLNFIISNILKEHSKEYGILYLLKHIHFSSLESNNEKLTIEEIINLLTLFQNVELFQQLSSKNYEKETHSIKDYSYEIEQKDKFISELQTNLEEYKLKYLTVRYPPITEKPKDYESDFFEACRDGKLSSVRYLIENEGVDINRYFCPLNFACEYGHFDIVKYLIEKANVNKEEHDNHKNKETPLCRSCESGNLSLVKYLIEDAKVDLTKYSNMKISPLHCACDSGHLPIVKYLIETVGFNPNGNKGQICSPLECALSSGYIPIFKYLIERCKVDPNQKNDKGESPLFTAISTNRFNIVKYLIEQVKVNIDITILTSGQNALHVYIVLHENIKMIKYFIEQVGININIQDSNGNTLLHVAYDNNRKEIAEYLILQGIDQTIKNSLGELAISLKRE